MDINNSKVYCYCGITLTNDGDKADILIYFLLDLLLLNNSCINEAMVKYLVDRETKT